MLTKYGIDSDELTNPTPIEVTDIISDNNGVITFKHPKQVDGEVEAVEFAEWIHVNAQPRLPNKNQWKMYSNTVVITTKELYEIFKNQK